MQEPQELKNHDLQRIGNEFAELYSYGRFGPDRDRTGGLHNANVALSQLSYGPSQRRMKDIKN